MSRFSLTSALTVLLLLFPLALPARAGGDCLTCHRQQTPEAVRIWRQSAHAAAGVGCADCHGHDHQAMLAGKARVDRSVCGRCHARALREHVRSRHGMGLHAGWGCTRNLKGGGAGNCRFCHRQGSDRPVSTVECARYLKQSVAMRALGCNRCHQIERSCAACHTDHATDLTIVRNPNVCATCHMGPDHPQWEMWQTSRHGTLFTSAGERMPPSCQSCHMPGGTHDVSGGITATPGGALPGEKRPAPRGDAKGLGRCHAASPAEEN